MTPRGTRARAALSTTSAAPALTLDGVLSGSAVARSPEDEQAYDGRFASGIRSFHISNPGALAPATCTQHVPAYLGIFEGNDPRGRLMAMINSNQDIGEYWEWSPDGFIPIPLTNEAYKFGVNYIIYAMMN